MGNTMQNNIELSGSNFEIGEQLGRYWGDYFQDQNSNIKIIKDYPKWITQKPEYNQGLFDNTKKYFPEIMEEINGMAQGINNSNLKLKRKVTLKDVFVRCLWEEKRSCTSAVYKKNDGYLLCHNLEDELPVAGSPDGIYPLLLSKVNLINGKQQHSFISISYPFSLLGVVGVNQNFAYQGNAIGDKGKTTTKTWHKRIPAMIFQRKLLEMTSVEGIEFFLQKYHITTPGHFYIVFHDNAYSLEVRPTKIERPLAHQYKLNLRKSSFHIHTNYFRNKNTIDKNWLFPKEKSDEKIFDWRFEKLKEFSNKYFQKEPDEQKIRKFFVSLARVNYKYTSASLFLNVSKNKKICSGVFYFGDKEQEIKIELGCKDKSFCEHCTFLPGTSFQSPGSIISKLIKKPLEKL